jgi:cyclopropane fatty-acyl-phospholipid synthase-like methyltransferase
VSDPRGFLRRRVWQLQSVYWERRLGVDTRGHVPAAVASGEQHDYSSLPYAAIFAVLDALALGPQDVLVDLGSGKGRVLCCAARRPLRLVTGVEYSEALCQLAEENVTHMRGRRVPVRVECGRAEDTDFAGVTVVYLYNPFGEETLRRVLEALGQSLAQSPRALRLAYVNPQHEGPLEACGYLDCYERWARDTHKNVHHAVSFWRHVPPASGPGSADGSS